MQKTKIYNFDADKNVKLIETRNISFEEIIIALGTEKLLDIIIHPNKIKYPNQKMYVIELNEYVYLVPFVEDGSQIFLKTAFPSRQATKHYLKAGGSS